MNADEGMRVQEGQVLAVLDDSDARVRLNSAQADRDATSAALADLEVNLANADRELRRTQELETGGRRQPAGPRPGPNHGRQLSRPHRVWPMEQVRAADARIKVAQQDLDNCTVRSPFAGIVVSKDAQVGEMVSPISAGGGFTRTGIATIVDMDSNEIEVDVNESYIARVVARPAGDRRCSTPIPTGRFRRKVRTVIPTADRQKATVKVRISFDKLDPRILPDMGVKVAFLSDEPAAKQTAAAQVRRSQVRGPRRRRAAGGFHLQGRPRGAPRRPRGRDAGRRRGDPGRRCRRRPGCGRRAEGLKDGQRVGIKK